MHYDASHQQQLSSQSAAKTHQAVVRLGIAILLAWMSYWSCTSRASAEELCPQGPFETDPDKIAAQLAKALPPEITLGTAIRLPTPPDKLPISNGATQFAAGGLRPPTLHHLDITRTFNAEYDADLYVSRHVIRQETWKNGRHLDISYFVTTSRPTPQQAKDIACLANQFLNPSDSLLGPIPITVIQPTDPDSLPEVVVTRQPPERCEVWYSDGYTERLSLITSTPPRVPGTRSIPCSTRLELERHLNTALGASYADALREKDSAALRTRAAHGPLRRTVDHILQHLGFNSSR